MRYLAKPVDDLDLIDGVYGRGKTTVDTKYLVINDNTQSKEIEHIGKVVPDIGVAVFSGTLGIEAIRLGHTAGLVVASNKMNALGVSQFQTNEQ